MRRARHGALVTGRAVGFVEIGRRTRLIGCDGGNPTTANTKARNQPAARRFSIERPHWICCTTAHAVRFIAAQTWAYDANKAYQKKTVRIVLLTCLRYRRIRKKSHASLFYLRFGWSWPVRRFFHAAQQASFQSRGSASMEIHRSIRPGNRLLAAAVALTLGSAAHAADEVQVEAEWRPRGDHRHRPQARLEQQDVPIAISAVSEQQLRRIALNDVRALGQIAPGLVLSNPPGSTQRAAACAVPEPTSSSSRRTRPSASWSTSSCSRTSHRSS